MVEATATAVATVAETVTAASAAAAMGTRERRAVHPPRLPATEEEATLRPRVTLLRRVATTIVVATIERSRDVR